MKSRLRALGRLVLATVLCAVLLPKPVARGGTVGDHAQDMGPYFSAVCTDDQGTTFGVMSAALE